jgi:hypothetical protein
LVGLQVSVVLKNAVHEPSTALRSCTELALLLKQSEGLGVPVLFGLTDGGSEHRMTFASVPIALIGLFRLLDVDFAVFVRTCPGHSWTNPVERCVPLLNTALSGVAVDRQKIADANPARAAAMEATVLKARSMKELRRLATLQPELKGKVLESCASISDVLMGRFKQIKLKDTAITEAPKASDGEVEELFAAVNRLCLTPGDTTLQAIKDKHQLKRFTAKRVVMSKYVPAPLSASLHQSLSACPLRQQVHSNLQEEVLDGPPSQGWRPRCRAGGCVRVQVQAAALAQ